MPEQNGCYMKRGLCRFHIFVDDPPHRLGLVALYTGVPDFPGDNALTALGVGIASGLAATGAHQVGKQFKTGV